MAVDNILADSVNDAPVPDGAGGFVINAIRAGTVAHTKDGKPFTFCAKLLERMAPSWVGGFIKYNHMLPGQGKIVASVWKDPHVAMTVKGLGEEVDEHITANRHTGFSVDAAGDTDDISTIVGTGISILFDNHIPACGGAMGCGVTERVMAETNIEAKATELHIDTLTEKLAAAEALVAERDATIKDMFTGDEIEAAKADAAKAVDIKRLANEAAMDAVTKIFPDGLGDAQEEVEASIMAEDYHGALVKLGEVKVVSGGKVPTAAPETVEAEEKVVSASALDKALLELKAKYIGA